MFFLRTKDNWAITILLNNIASKEGVNYGMLFTSVNFDCNTYFSSIYGITEIHY